MGKNTKDTENNLICRRLTKYNIELSRNSLTNVGSNEFNTYFALFHLLLCF